MMIGQVLPSEHAVRTHIPDFDGLKHYMGVLHMGDHAVLIVKAWYKLTWGFIHRHLGVILRYLFQGVRNLSIYVGYETLWPAQETTEACDWYAYLRYMATLCIWFDRYICVLLTKNKLKCLYVNILYFFI